MNMSEINWIRLGKEIAQMPNGIAVLRVLEAHGVRHFVRFSESGSVSNSCSIEMVIDYAHKEK
jgi:hypothetical protein